MPLLDLTLVIVYAAAGLIMAGLTGLAALAPVLIPRLRASRGEAAERGAGPPTIIVLAARDEAARIERTVREALAQHPEQRVVVADDRSTDGTTAILAELAEEHPGLTVVRIDALPGGWLGKTHALHTALRFAPAAEAPWWVLFIDADTHLAPGTVEAAVGHAERKGAEHLIALPGYPATGVVGAAVSAATYLIFIARCVANQLGLPWTGVGIGAFTLVRREALDAIGGLERLRLEVVEDLKLGVFLQRAGFRTAVVNATHAVSIDWQADAGRLIKLLEKNFFSLTYFSVVRSAGYIGANVGCFLAGISGWALAAFGTGLHPAPRVVAAAATAVLIAKAVPATMLVRAYGWPTMAGLLAPLAMTAPAVALWNSTVRTLRDGGVTWRETHYPLETLRREQTR